MREGREESMDEKIKVLSNRKKKIKSSRDKKKVGEGGRKVTNKSRKTEKDNRR